MEPEVTDRQGGEVCLQSEADQFHGDFCQWASYLAGLAANEVEKPPGKKHNYESKLSFCFFKSSPKTLFID